MPIGQKPPNMVSQKLQQRILDILARERALSRSVSRLDDESRVFNIDQERFFANFNAQGLHHRRRSAPDTRRRHRLVTDALSHQSTEFQRPYTEVQDDIEATSDNEWDAPGRQQPDGDDLSSDHSSQVVQPRAVVQDGPGPAIVHINGEQADFRRQRPALDARPRTYPDADIHTSRILTRRVAVRDDLAVKLDDEQATQIPEAVPEPQADMDASRRARTHQKRRRVTFSEDDYIINSSDDVSSFPGVPTDDANIPFTRSAYTGEGHIVKRARRNSREPVPLPQPPTHHESSRATHQPYVGIWNPRLPAGGPIKPILREEYDGLNARADEVESRTPCPYPDCGKMFEAVQSKDRHLRRDHPDWCIVMDQVNREAMY
ncbi:hypothetical protein D6C77_04742 [Aureobasidium pullulans]|nr:hypothetical protein D6C77_04742 [Aureobasidium pullulans]